MLIVLYYLYLYIGLHIGTLKYHDFKVFKIRDVQKMVTLKSSFFCLENKKMSCISQPFRKYLYLLRVPFDGNYNLVHSEKVFILLRKTFMISYISYLFFACLSIISFVGNVCATQQIYDRPAVLFSHGIADTYRQAFRYYNLKIIKKPFYTFNFPDATLSCMKVDRTLTVFGQEDEINCLSSAYDQVRILEPEKPVLLYGVSRGASTILNFIAHRKPENIKAIILESPFASIDDVISYLASKNKVSLGIARKIFSYIFPRYKWLGLKPLDIVDAIPKDTPILLICSTSDALVPSSTTIKLYNALLNAGCHVYLAVLNVGSHAKLFLSDDWPLYKKAVHAFYKKSGLEHDTNLAHEGEHLLFNTPYLF